MAFLVSLLDPTRLVLDVKDNLAQSGQPVELWPRKYDTDPNELRNQQWQLAGQYLVSGLGGDLVLDVANLNRTPGAGVQVWTRNTPETPNQLWSLVPGPYQSSFYIESLLGNGLVLTAAGPGMQVITGVADPTRPQNQLWMWVA